jgi:hypothetical protein
LNGEETVKHALMVALLVLTQAACATRQVTRESVATPESIAMLGSQTGIAVRLRDGTEIQMGAPIDYGDAFCASSGCARKSEIVSIMRTSNEMNAGGTAATYGTVALFAAPLALVTMAFAAKSLGAGGSGAATEDKSEPLTAELEKRIWLEGLLIHDRRIVGRQGNSCVDASMFTTDAQALQWIGEHRNNSSQACIGAAGYYILEHPDLDLKQTGMELWALGAIRGRWDAMRCRTLPQLAPLAPPVLDSFGRRGDPRFPEIIAATLADPGTYTYALDLENFCDGRGGVSDEGVWPARLAQIKAAGPFPKATPPE